MLKRNIENIILQRNIENIILQRKLDNIKLERKLDKIKLERKLDKIKLERKLDKIKLERNIKNIFKKKLNIQPKKIIQQRKKQTQQTQHTQQIQQRKKQTQHTQQTQQIQHIQQIRQTYFENIIICNNNIQTKIKLLYDNLDKNNFHNTGKINEYECILNILNILIVNKLPLTIDISKKFQTHDYKCGEIDILVFSHKTNIPQVQYIIEIKSAYKSWKPLKQIKYTKCIEQFKKYKNTFNTNIGFILCGKDSEFGVLKLRSLLFNAFITNNIKDIIYEILKETYLIDYIS